MDTAILARRGRLLLWLLVGSTALTGIGLRYAVPETLYIEIATALVRDYAPQERVLAQIPWTDGAHRVLGVALLVLGMLQFDPKLRRDHPRAHRLGGQLFLGLAAVAAVSGTAISLLHGFAGMEQDVFVVLVSGLLLWFAVSAWTAARRRQFARHREWMIRTFGTLLFIAVQRIYFLPLMLFTDIPGPEVFALTGWLALITVLVAAETWINLTRPQGVNAPLRA